MSEPHTVPHTITYSEPCEGDALFIAGTFSNPQWLLQEMRRSTLPDGSVSYSICVQVEVDKEHQYRFKQGREGCWAVDEQKPIVKSALGTKSNILRPGDAGKQDSRRDSVSLTVPLFAHERLGAYTFSDNGDDTTDLTSELKREISPRTVGDMPADFNDPTLESFPCDKSSIIGTLRKIQTSLGEQPVGAENGRSTRRSSVDSDDGSSGSLSPSARTYQRRSGRLNGNSHKRNQSMVSLCSISEEPTGNTQKVERSGLAKPSIADGEGLTMRAASRN